MPDDEGTYIPREKGVTPLHDQSTADCILRAGDYVSRHGGDQFLCMLIHVKNVEDTLAIADRVVCAIGKPFDIFGNQIWKRIVQVL